MTVDYIPPLCPGPDPGADWQEMGWCCHDCAALAHVAWCPNHPGYWKNGAAVMQALSDEMTIGPDEPVPFTLTPKALAALASPRPAVPLAVRAVAPLAGIALYLGAALAIVDGHGEWGCERCGAGWFGTPPDDGLCLDCRASA